MIKGTISIGQLADRTGMAVSAIRYYDSVGLLSAERNAGGQRRFMRTDIRRVSFIMIAQQMGFSLAEIAEALSGLPEGRAPSKSDWARIGKKFRKALDARIDTLIKLRDNLDGCIGCGCLSLPNCALYNPIDRAARLGRGPRYLMGDSPENPS